MVLIYSQAAVAPLSGETGDPDASGLLRALYYPAYAAAVVLIAAAWRRSLLALLRAPLLIALVTVAASSALWSVAPDITVRRSVALAFTCLSGVALAARFSWARLAEVLACGFALLALASLGGGPLRPLDRADERSLPGLLARALVREERARPVHDDRLLRLRRRRRAQPGPPAALGRGRGADGPARPALHLQDLAGQPDAGGRHAGLRLAGAARTCGRDRSRVARRRRRHRASPASSCSSPTRPSPCSARTRRSPAGPRSGRRPCAGSTSGRPSAGATARSGTTRTSGRRWPRSPRRRASSPGTPIRAGSSRRWAWA